MTQDQILLGAALTVALAVGSQILASKLHVPSLIVLLPVGFAAGALTKVVRPDNLVPDFTALVSLGVAVILYDAGLGLDPQQMKGETRSVVTRLIVLGIPITAGACLGLVVALFDVPVTVALMLGVILVVSGPTVVGPLLEHARLADRVRSVLTWEGTLVDPLGGILGAVVFHFIVRLQDKEGYRVGLFFGSMAVGLVAAPSASRCCG
ncbi:cation:proton antiporter [Kitasatospora arboriphila]